MNGQATVDQFFGQMGLPPAPMPVALGFERSGQLNLLERDGALLALLSRHVPVHRTGVAAAALRAVHPARGLPFAVRAAFHSDETLVFIGRIPAPQVDLPALDRLVQLLSRLADEAMAAG